MFNLCISPNLVGLKYTHVRHGIQEVELHAAFIYMYFPKLFFYDAISFSCGQAVVCGIFRDGNVNFHPSEDEEIRQTDKVCMCIF